MGEVVLGVDTHGEVHVAAVLCPLGQVLGTKPFPATAVGYRGLLAWAGKLGTVHRAGVEGTGTFGAGLSRYLLAQHVEVYEVNRPDRTARRLRGKSDPLDAQAAARAVLSGRAKARAKTGDGPVQSARMFKLAKDSAVKARTQAINQLKAVLVIADPALRNDCPAWATASCSAPAHASARATGTTRTPCPRPPASHCACSPSASSSTPGRSKS
ncbi:transposase [Streptomyces sp. P9-2B-2]|uniref:IS110 family transposase n=1 Tax=Streptomyces sp. P9-2B-2 TaxID=3057114 RepID=UPI0025B3A472|nr:transposase [Streptomyces sp. P9-2B-2]WJY41564.1 transposase [Streptomyces sp. P9-2B-2]